MYSTQQTPSGRSHSTDPSAQETASGIPEDIWTLLTEPFGEETDDYVTYLLESHVREGQTRTGIWRKIPNPDRIRERLDTILGPEQWSMHMDVQRGVRRPYLCTCRLMIGAATRTGIARAASLDFVQEIALANAAMFFGIGDECRSVYDQVETYRTIRDPK